MVEDIEKLASVKAEFIGLSIDTKPTTGIEKGSTFLELDSGYIWIFSKRNINPATSNGWWRL